MDSSRQPVIRVLAVPRVCRHRPFFSASHEWPGPSWPAASTEGLLYQLTYLGAFRPSFAIWRRREATPNVQV